MYNVLDFTLEELQSWMKENGESASFSQSGSNLDITVLAEYDLPGQI